MITSHHYYVHEFDELETAPFSTKEYSKLKFGDDRAARAFAREIARGLGDLVWHSDSKLCIIPAPSASVPVAATLLARHVRDLLNDSLSRVDRPTVDYTEIHRDPHYNVDYAERTLEERQELLQDEGRYINESYVRGKKLVFIDDVRITGTHEVKVNHLLAARGLDNERYFAAIARYTGSDPSIEHRLNHCYVRGAEEVFELAFADGYRVTTRAIRQVLREPVARLEKLLPLAPFNFIVEAYHAALVKEYHLLPDYKESFALLRSRFDAITGKYQINSHASEMQVATA